MTISIVVPVYNVEPYIRHCLDSIVGQTHADFECILVDDGSTDASGRICDEYAAKDSRFKVCHKPNGGLVSARKAGVELATGDYVCFVDSDDYIGETYIASFADIIAQHAPDMIANEYFERFYEDAFWAYSGSTMNGLFEAEPLDALRSRFVFDHTVNDFNFGIIMPSLCMKCFRRELLAEQYAVCDESISMGEDMMISAPLSLRCQSIYITQFKGYFYRDNPTSIVNTFKTQRFCELQALTAYLHEQMPSHRVQIAYYAMRRLYQDIVSFGKCADSSAAFARGLNEKLSTDWMRLLKTADVRGWPIKKRVVIFLIRHRMWGILFRLIRKFSAN